MLRIRKARFFRGIRLVLLVLVAQAVGAGAALAGVPGSYGGPSNAELDAAREWLWENPPNGSNRAERLERMAVIQAAADELDKHDGRLYLLGLGKGSKDLDRYGALYYLRRATDHAIADLRRTEVKHGLVGWHLYNMGYVFKTPEACFGVDVCLRDATSLVGDLDFLLVTHEHLDHHAGGLVKAMGEAGKPVITRFSRHGMVVEEPCVLTLGPIRVRIDIGDHSPSKGGVNDMLMFEIACGEAAGGCVIYHSGDGANYGKMTPEKPVDIFIPHVSCGGMDVAQAIRHMNPAITFVSHVMELTHDRRGARWRYDFAYEQVKGVPEERAVVLTWGERWLLPGTEVRRH
ncbi:MAG TPA: hypothetical protein ENN80_11925 [Candidatus Hydrogenedentes bacterium]|nr:hypothetical protein [Candidatus Hydrogenedentota bacterium]